jgi:hypothetical protein
MGDGGRRIAILDLRSSIIDLFFLALTNFFIVKGKVSLEISKFRAMATRIDTD